jgi:hypothetical protein
MLIRALVNVLNRIDYITIETVAFCIEASERMIKFLLVACDNVRPDICQGAV